MALQEVRDRISLVARLLTSLQGHGAAYSRASDEQSIVLAQKLSSRKLSLEEATELAEAVSRIPWQDSSHRETVQASLVSDVAVVASSNNGTRRSMQHFEAMPNYYTDQQWRFFHRMICLPRSCECC